ncbi:hypothetical protein NN561_018842 [Cricetulus griseus]
MMMAASKAQMKELRSLQARVLRVKARFPERPSRCCCPQGRRPLRGPTLVPERRVALWRGPPAPGARCARPPPPWPRRVPPPSSLGGWEAAAAAAAAAAACCVSAREGGGSEEAPGATAAAEPHGRRARRGRICRRCGAANKDQPRRREVGCAASRGRRVPGGGRWWSSHPGPVWGPVPALPPWLSRTCRERAPRPHSPLPKLPGLGAALSPDAALCLLPPGWQSPGTVAELIPAGSLVCFPPHSVALTFANLRLHLYFS